MKKIKEENLPQILEYNGKKAVSAKEVHAFLETRTRFNDWISIRIQQCNLKENRDFVRFTENPAKPQGGRPSADYALTLGAAKELCMVEFSDRGKQAREYFIKCEEELKDIVTPLSALENILGVLKSHDKRLSDLENKQTSNSTQKMTLREYFIATGILVSTHTIRGIGRAVKTYCISNSIDFTTQVNGGCYPEDAIKRVLDIRYSYLLTA